MEKSINHTFKFIPTKMGHELDSIYIVIEIQYILINSCKIYHTIVKYKCLDINKSVHTYYQYKNTLQH